MASVSNSVDPPRMWSVFKELFNTVESSISRREAFAQQDLEAALQRHKPDFASLLKNPDKNAADQNLVKNANVNGLPVHGQQGLRTFTSDFISEALTLSDLFELNELAAVDLLRMGEIQQSYFPGFSRGLVAVILYYDGKASLVGALRMLIQARKGRTWALPGLSDDLVATATRFTDQVMNENLVSRILNLLETISVTSELSRLQQPTFRALGPPKHRKMVTDKITEIQQGLADCLFCWSCQASLSRQEVLLLIGHLAKDSSVNADGTLTNVALTLLLALLYSIDVRVLEEEDVEVLMNQLPVISDATYRQDVHREICSITPWANPGLKAVVQFAWALTLHRLSQYLDLGDMCDLEELLVNAAIEGGLFFFLRTAVIANSGFHDEEYYVRKVHTLVTDFIEHMPLKVKELRNYGDEAARIIVASQQEGIDPPPNLSRDFEHMLTMIGELYGKDPLNLELALEYWCPSDSLMPPSFPGYSGPYNVHPSQRQISLFKFVRLAGDLLLPPMFVPYIYMLTGLANGTQSAHQCFNLLKMNGASTAGSQLSTVSWDHFFMSLNQYFINLRQEAPPTAERIQAYHYYRCGITPQEVDGLRAVLQLITLVVTKDENARIALSENQQWLPLVVLFGLVSCSIPPKLKAELLGTLAAFARTPETGAALWQSMEMSQILQTVSTTRGSGGIQIELEEIEARNEEYPLTLAFMELISVLTENPIPAGLGIRIRAPGFQPYIDFLKDSVFLKFTSRAYKKPEEKWEVGAAVLEIFHKLLSAYEVIGEDFLDKQYEVQGEGILGANKPPGFVLMVHMMNESGMLKMILFVLEEAIQAFEKYVPFPGKSALEKVAFLCLKMIEATLEKQHEFLDALRQSGTSLIVTQMDRLLLGINPRTGRPDYLVNIAKYVAHAAYLPKHALSALHILIGVCQSPLVQPKIVGLFTADEKFSQDLLHGFAMCLESDEPEKVEAKEDYLDIDVSLSQVRNRMREDIVWLLLSTIDHPAPNLAHFLLGFELRKPVDKTNLQDPGVLGCPRTCLHSLVTVLSRGLDLQSGPTCLYVMPKLAELAYHVVYVLSTNSQTYGPTLRYLRMHDFFYRQCQHLPFQPQLSEDSLLMHQSWLLKSVVVELRVTSVNRQRSHAQRMMNLLLSESPDTQSKFAQTDGGFDPDYVTFGDDYSGASHLRSANPAFVDGQVCRKLSSILSSVDFSFGYPGALELEVFSKAAVELLMENCEQRNGQGLALCNVKLLHRILLRECSGMTGAQSAFIARDIQQICSNAVERNAYKETIYRRRQAFDAWRQTIEILLTACPLDLLDGERRQKLLFELLQDLLDKVSKSDAVSELTSPVAGVILTLMAHLTQCFVTPQSAYDQLTDHAQYVSMLDGQNALPGSHDISTVLGEVVTGSRTQYASSFQVVLRGLLDHILRSSSSAQRVRAYLYGALLYYLEIARKPKPLEISASASVERSVASRLANRESEYERLAKENADTLNSYGQNLMDIICRDACDGHDVGRMLALACLDVILTDDYRQAWLNHLSSKGYLQHIIEMFLKDDAQLQALLLPQPEPLRALYIFQSKICMLTKTAATLHGARILLECGVMSRLVECSVFDLRPEPDRAMEGFIPSVLTRYRQQILFPVLRLCLSLLTSFGSGNQFAASQVLKFIVAHADVFMSILRDRHSVLTLESLQELQLTTAVVCRAAVDDGVEEFLLSDAVHTESLGTIRRLQRQMFALLPKYCPSEKQPKRTPEQAAGGLGLGLDARSEEERADLAVQMQIITEEILANVITLCRTLIAKPGATSKEAQILFEPSLAEGMARNLRGFEDLTGNLGNNSSRPLNLGVIVYLLSASAQLFMTTLESHKQLYHKYLNVADMSTEVLKEFYVGEKRISDKMSIQQRNQMVSQRLGCILHFKSKELQLLSYVIENCMLLLWHHLEFFLVSCKPLDAKTSLLKRRATNQMRKLNDASMQGAAFDAVETGGVESCVGGLSQDQLMQLKREAVACINETLLKRLEEMEKCYTSGRTRFGFVTAMVRRLRRLLRLHTV